MLCVTVAIHPPFGASGTRDRKFKMSTATRRHSTENLIDAKRIVEVATRYPHIEVSALAERFGVADRTIRYVLERAGIRRSDDDLKPVKIVDAHPWRPVTRRRVRSIAISKAEKQRLVAEFLAKNSVTKVPRGQMTTGEIIFLDQLND